MISEFEKENRAVLPYAFRVLEAGSRQGSSSSLQISSEEHLAEVPFDLDALIHAAREEGVQAGLMRAAEVFERQLARERSALSRCMEQFGREKQRYFADVECEVVRLSLAIAKRILHREAAMDPTLLAGAARVALEQVAEGSEAVLRVPSGELETWQKVFRRRTDAVEVLEDIALNPGECVLETRSGSVQLGVRAQLEEIEHGFFQLMQRKPVGELAAS